MRQNRIRHLFGHPPENSLLEATRDFLETAGLDYHCSGSDFVLVPGESEIHCRIDCESSLKVSVEWCKAVPHKRRTAVLTCLNVINGELSLGHLVLDPVSNSIGFRMGVYAPEDPSSLWVKRHVDLSLRLMALSTPILKDLLENHVSSCEATATLLEVLAPNPKKALPPRGFGWN